MRVVCTRNKTVFANFAASSTLLASEKPLARREVEHVPGDLLGREWGQNQAAVVEANSDRGAHERP